MKFSSSLGLYLLVGVGSATATSSGLPSRHPPVPAAAMHPTLAKFSSQFRCPYAQEWLTKGAQQAAIDLGLTTTDKQQQQHKYHRQRRRVLQPDTAAAVIMGRCSFTNAWTGETCMEFRGEGWTIDSMTERCAIEPDSTVTEGTACPPSSELAGYCLKEATAAANMIEATAMMVTQLSDCDGNNMACATFMSGQFDPAPGCASSEAGDDAASSVSADGGKDYANMGPPSSSDDVSCSLAPGAIGAAHQAAYSSGYSATCPGTPAEGSPYMWPLAWSANLDSRSMAYGSDDVVMTSQSRVFYRLDKNWKRSDTTLAQGVRRTVGQGPCAPEQIDQEFSQNGLIACIMDDDVSTGSPLTTMIHQGGKMYFVTWKNDTDVPVGETDPSLIADCGYMDLMVIGNIRPDWFLDDRGDDTDVQYLGDQHAYYAALDKPKLLKQWRKKDFANQYFVMSMQGNPPANKTNTEAPIEDTMHWPLILNVPGEGFGDDFLQLYTNHKLLSDDDDDLFNLVDNLIEMGGSCPLIPSSGDGSIGPPTTEVHIPSNLEVDPNSWFKNVYTFSPVWQPPMNIATDDSNTMASGSSDSNSMAVTEKERVRVQSCYDETTKSVHLNVAFQDIKPIAMGAASELPWMSLGYRSSELCAMTPPDGSDSNIIMIAQQKAYVGTLSAAAKSMSPTALSAITESLSPLEEMTGYSDVSVTAPMMSDSNTDETLIAIERSSPTTTTAITPSSSDTSVTLSFKQEFTNGPPDVMHLMYAIGMTAELGFHVSRSCFDIVDFPVCSSSSSASSSSDEVPPPRTNESIEAWKEENALQSSSLGQFGSSTSAAVAVTVTILLSAFIF